MTDDFTPRIVIAGQRPPREFGFIPAKSGKSWWLRTGGLSSAQKVAAQLQALGIHGVIKLDHRLRHRHSRAGEAQWRQHHSPPDPTPAAAPLPKPNHPTPAKPIARSPAEAVILHGKAYRQYW
jgi:hypothetical protein